MQHWIIVGAAIILLYLHERLSATKYWLLGGVLPLVSVAVMIYQLLIAKIDFSAQIIIAYAVFFMAAVLLWVVGQYEYRQKELKRMKARDIG